MKKPATSKPKKHTKRKISGLVFLLALLALAGFISYKHHQKTQAIAKERAEYAQARIGLGQDLKKIISRLDTPEEKNDQTGCGYASQEFGHGPLYCGVGWSLKYRVSDIYQAKQLAYEIETVLVGKPDPSKFISDKTAQSDIDFGRPPISIGSLSYSLQGLDCFRSYKLNSDNNSLLLRDSTALTLAAELNCSAKQPLTAYYPITK